MPIVKVHREIFVVRDDLTPCGTKGRYIAEAFDDASTVVYASPCEGGAQVSLAYIAKELGKRAVIVCAKRKVKHHRTMQALQLGAEIIEIDGMAMLNVVQSRARQIAIRQGWKLAPFGLQTPGAIAAIARAALETELIPDEVWSVAGSGVLARGLSMAWPMARRHAVQTGHKLTSGDVGGARIHVYPKSFRTAVPCDEFPSDPHYDAKGWQVCLSEHGPGVVVFWNVLGTTVHGI